MLGKILVIGDIMVDIHLDCDSERLSPEAPVPICLLNNQYKMLGGSSNVAAQIAICYEPVMAYVHSSYTSDIEYEFVKFKNMCGNITLLPLRTKEIYKIPQKTRVWANRQQVCRIDNELSLNDLNKLNFYNNERNSWLDAIKECIIDNNIRLIILSDYNKGTLTDVFLQGIVNLANKYNVITILDPKRPTYRDLVGISVVTPNNAEMEKTILSPSQLSSKLNNTYMLHTRGSEGMTCYKNGNIIESIEAHKVDVVETCGAGDCVVAFLAMILAANNFNLNDDTIKIAMCGANYAASKEVQHRGSYVLNQDECQEVFNFCRGV